MEGLQTPPTLKVDESGLGGKIASGHGPSVESAFEGPPKKQPVQAQFPALTSSILEQEIP